MPRPRLTTLVFALVALATCVGSADAATRALPRTGIYSPAASGPFRLAAPPTGMTSLDAAGDGYDDLVVGSAPEGRIQLLELRDGRIDGSRTRASTVPPVALAAAVSRGAGMGAPDEVLVAGVEEARIYAVEQFYLRRARVRPGESIVTGADPAAVAGIEPIGVGPFEGKLDTAEYVVVNRGSDDVSLIDRDWTPELTGRKGRLRELARVPVGDAPVAVAEIGGIHGDLLVANSGSGTITYLRIGLDGDVRPETVEVGGEPVAIATGDFVRDDHGDREAVVIDRAGDSMLLLDSRRDPAGGPPLPYEVVSRFSVGDEPVDLLAAGLDDSPGVDIAVVNSGSDDVSLLLGNGFGFVGGGTYPVGRQPVAIEPTAYGRWFDRDLVVANRGSRDLTFLVRNEFGRCQGRPARLRIGTPNSDGIGPGYGPNQIVGQGGDDHIRGALAPDCLFGEPGDDTIVAADRVRDIVNCGSGTDTARSDPLDVLVGCERVRERP